MLSSNKIKFIILFISLIISYYVTLRVDAPNYEDKFQRQVSIINNSIEHPYKYRLLNPFLTHAYYSVFKLAISEKSSFLLAYTVQNFLVFLFLFYAFSRFLSVWFDEAVVIIGILMFASIIPITLTGWDTLGDITTAGLMAMGFYFINSGKENLLFPVLLVGAFNELQIILLILFYFFSKRNNFASKKVWIRTVLMVIAFAVVYFLIFFLRGGVLSLDIATWSGRRDMFFNISNANFIILWVVLLLPLLYYALKDFKSKPEFLRINFIIVIPIFYLIAFFVLARMREIDKALTIFIIEIPLALHSLMPTHLKTNLKNS